MLFAKQEMFKTNDIWLCIVAQPAPITKKALYFLLLKEKNMLPNKSYLNGLNMSVRNLVDGKNVVKSKINGELHYEYTDDCRHRPVTGNDFSKAVDSGLWSIDNA
jgi:hypothetical protein